MHESPARRPSDASVHRRWTILWWAFALIIALYFWSGCNKPDFRECRGGAPVAGLCYPNGKTGPAAVTPPARGGGPAAQPHWNTDPRDGGILRPGIKVLPDNEVRVGPQGPGRPRWSPSPR